MVGGLVIHNEASLVFRFALFLFVYQNSIRPISGPIRRPAMGFGLLARRGIGGRGVSTREVL